MPFTLVHAGKYRTKDRLQIQTIQKLNTFKPRKTNNTKHSKTKLPWFSRLYDTRPWNDDSTMLLSPHRANDV